MTQCPVLVVLYILFVYEEKSVLLSGYMYTTAQLVGPNSKQFVGESYKSLFPPPCQAYTHIGKRVYSLQIQAKSTLNQDYSDIP